MTSPWLTASQTAPSPCSWVMRASWRVMAATPRSCMARIDSPPGKVAAEGCDCTVFQSFSLARSFSGRPCHSP